ncbi:MAG: o-succinylbenzoate synthase [Acidimicrobiia bacterium]|nr:o-succinylbenzoate synthase [Acidimicrobiia bacterium]
MHVSGIELRLLSAKLREPFKTSYGSIVTRSPIVVRLFGDTYEGWAECPADVAPSTDHDPVATAWNALEHGLSKQILGINLAHPTGIKFDHSQTPTATAAVEMALWDLHAKSLGLPLWHVLQGSRRPVASGVVVGIPDSLSDLVEIVARRVAEGYQRVKLKIRPGWDLEPIQTIRSQWPDLAISADANGAYSPSEAGPLHAIDHLGLQYLEQPFPPPTIEHHARLAETMATPVCLDESLPDRSSVQKALERFPGFVINAKPSRLGGHTETIAVHNLAVDAGADLWCGGYLETGIGRAHLVAVATLPGFTLPADASASARYWQHDLAIPEWTIWDGALHPSAMPGIGVEVDSELLDRLTTRRIFLEV